MSGCNKVGFATARSSGEAGPDRGLGAAAALTEQSQASEAGMALAADHQVIVDRDAERLGSLADLLGHLDVVARRLAIAARMVVPQCSMRTYGIDFQGNSPVSTRRWDME